MAKHADYNMNHKEDWFQAIKTGKRPCMDIEIAHRVANAEQPRQSVVHPRAAS